MILPKVKKRGQREGNSVVFRRDSEKMAENFAWFCAIFKTNTIYLFSDDKLKQGERQDK